MQNEKQLTTVCEPERGSATPVGGAMKRRLTLETETIEIQIETNRQWTI